MTEVPEKQFAERLTWAFCEASRGGGPGKCDPEYCVCGAEGREVAAIIYKAGWRMVAPSPAGEQLNGER